MGSRSVTAMSVEREVPLGASPASVVHVIPNDQLRGAQVVARDLCARLDALGHHRHELVTLFDAPTTMLGPVRALGVTPGRMRRLGFDVRAAIRLRRVLHQVRPAVVVAHGSEPLKYAIATAAAIPIVYYRIGIAAASARTGWRRRLYRRLAARAALVVAISADSGDEVVDLLGVPRARVVVVPNGRDPAVYAAASTHRTSTAVKLLFVGHLSSSKRPALFVDLVAELRQRGLAVDGEVVGDGPLLDELTRSAPPGVEVLGLRRDVPDLLAGADVFVFTSVPEGEGMPGVLIEAAMAGLPVVATRVPGVADVVVEGVTGFVVPADNPLVALADAVQQLIEHPDLRQRMGAAGRDHAVAHFGIDGVVAAWNEALRHVTVAPLRGDD